MQVSKKKGKVLDDAIKHWRKTDVISKSESSKLKASYEVVSFDWRRLAKYSFQLAIACIIISVASILFDQWLIELLEKLFNEADSIKCIGFAILSVGLYAIGVRRKNQQPNKVYSNEATFFLGVLATAASIAFLGKMMDTGSGHFSLLLLLAAIIYAFLGLWFSSKLVWLFALLSLGGWFGAETGYVSGWGAYYLSMNYPLRFVFFGLALILFGSYAFNYWKARRDFLSTTKAVGLLYLFIALWLMSIFGNYGDIDIWKTAKQIELFHWSILFAVAAIGSIYHGIKYNDGMTRGFGLTFIFINLYTRFFEYFWESIHKAIFFALLALSFWYLGTKAEKIWQLSLVKNLTRPKSARTK
jgi:hypothetical protein